MSRACKQHLLAMPGVGISLLPKLACPACWPAYAVGLNWENIMSTKKKIEIADDTRRDNNSLISFREKPSSLARRINPSRLAAQRGTNGNRIDYAAVLLVRHAAHNSAPFPN